MEKLIPKLIKQDRVAQKELFEKYSRKMLGVCRSYVSDIHFAEDCMLKGFVRVFNKIDTYKSQGSFEGWIRRVMVNECLDFIKSKKSMIYLDVIEEPDFLEEEYDLTGIDAQELLDQLPETYKVVFNLFVIEGYSHKEITDLLSITESASKTQLLRAKNKLKDLILDQKKKVYEK